MIEGLAARKVALDLAIAVLERGRLLDEALDGNADFPRLPPRDRGFVRLLLATLLRRLPEIEAALAALLDKPLPRKAPRSRLALALGAAQLLHLETPPHAAVSTAVELLGARESGFRGLVNAVLRRLAREGRALPPDEAARINTPAWLWNSWSAAYGEATALAIARQHLLEPPLDLTPRDPAEAATLAAVLGARVLPTGSLRLPPGAGEITRLQGFAAGRWWVQDAAAALPARLLGPVAGRRVADLCAAPGGKTLQLAAAGAAVTALDLSPERLARVRENLKRTGLQAEIVAADLLDWQPGRSFDAVLLDAPCSATGTLRRHPDLARHKVAGQVGELAALQQRMLAAAAALVAPGGSLLYAVCSLEPVEGAGQVEAFLAGRSDFRRQAIVPADVGGLAELLTSEGELRSLPCHLADQGGLDGFYACRLVRKAG
jgi:16S rRNA (cytosine967-C5)-methyltransferase